MNGIVMKCAECGLEFVRKGAGCGRRIYCPDCSYDKMANRSKISLKKMNEKNEKN